MINKPISSPDKVEKNTNQKNLKPISFLFAFVVISGLIAFLVGGYLIGKNDAKKENQNKSLTMDEQINLNPNDWTSYEFELLNIEFKLPNKLDKKIEWKIFELNKDKGKIICLSDQELKNDDLCTGEILIIGSASNNFFSTEKLPFIYNQGFIEENGEFYLKAKNNEKSKIENTKLKKFDNNEFEILKILGSESKSTPKSGHLGAIVNTNNAEYPSLVLIIKIEGEISEYEFDQILKSIKYKND